MTNPARAKAVAKAIRAVNAHGALVRALRECRDALLDNPRTENAFRAIALRDADAALEARRARSAQGLGSERPRGGWHPMTRTEANTAAVEYLRLRVSQAQGSEFTVEQIANLCSVSYLRAWQLARRACAQGWAVMREDGRALVVVP